MTVDGATLTSGVVSLIVGGGISIIVNWLSIRHQDDIVRKRLNDRDKENWTSDAISIIRRIRREALRFDASISISRASDGNFEAENGQDQIDFLADLVLELDHHQDDIPSDYSGSTINSAITEIIVAFEHTEEENNSFTAIELKDRLIEKSENALDRFQDSMEIQNQLY